MPFPCCCAPVGCGKYVDVLEEDYAGGDEPWGPQFQVYGNQYIEIAVETDFNPNFRLEDVPASPPSGCACTANFPHSAILNWNDSCFVNHHLFSQTLNVGGAGWSLGAHADFDAAKRRLSVTTAADTAQCTTTRVVDAPLVSGAYYGFSALILRDQAHALRISFNGFRAGTPYAFFNLAPASTHPAVVKSDVVKANLAAPHENYAGPWFGARRLFVIVQAQNPSPTASVEMRIVKPLAGFPYAGSSYAGSVGDGLFIFDAALEKLNPPSGGKYTTVTRAPAFCKSSALGCNKCPSDACYIKVSARAECDPGVIYASWDLESPLSGSVRWSYSFGALLGEKLQFGKEYTLAPITNITRWTTVGPCVPFGADRTLDRVRAVVTRRD